MPQELASNLHYRANAFASAKEKRDRHVAFQLPSPCQQTSSQYGVDVVHSIILLLIGYDVLDKYGLQLLLVTNDASTNNGKFRYNPSMVTNIGNGR